jgi:hypothetical protein
MHSARGGVAPGGHLDPDYSHAMTTSRGPGVRWRKCGTSPFGHLDIASGPLRRKATQDSPNRPVVFLQVSEVVARPGQPPAKIKMGVRAG